MLISKNQLNPKFKQKIRQATLDNAASSGMTQTVFNFYKVPESYKDFLSDCCRIRSGNKFVPFVPYDYQVAVSDLIDKARGVIIFKTRQIGITECIAGKFLHKALLNPAYAAAVLSLGQSESSNVATRIESMPAKIKGLEFVVNSKTKLHFKNAGKIWFRPATDNATRSLESISDIFYDESAFPINFEEIYGVQNAEILGGRKFALRAWLDRDRMAGLGVAPDDVYAAMATTHSDRAGRTNHCGNVYGFLQ